MGISFEDSLKQMVAEAQSADTIALEASTTDSTITPSVMTLSETRGMIVAYSGDEGNWSEYDTDYEIYSFFEDSNIKLAKFGR